MDRRLPSASIAILLLAGCMHTAPGRSFEGPLPALDEPQQVLLEELRADVHALSVGIGPRCAMRGVAKVREAQHWIESELRSAGLEVRLDEVDMNGTKVANVEGTLRGTSRPSEIVLLGAHYDTVDGSPGANDNASGVAALIAIASRLREAPPGRSVRVVLFVNEENPFSNGLQMGSRVYAKGCKERGDDIRAMLCIDSLGCYSSKPGSQDYPAVIGWFLPSTANFVAFCSDERNEELLDRVVGIFREHVAFPSLGVALDSSSVGRSDHASFWEQGYPALLVSDTSEYRDPNYHKRSDTAEKLDYEGLARVTDGLLQVVRVLASER